MDECSQQQREFITTLVALRKRVSDRRFDEQSGVLGELMQFIDYLESATPGEVPYQCALDVARSLAVLHLPLSALERVENLLLDGPRKKGGNELLTFEAGPSRHFGIGSPTSDQKMVGWAPDATELAKANAHIMRATTHLLEQAERLQYLRSIGADCTESVSLLQNIWESLRVMHLHRRLIRQGLSPTRAMNPAVDAFLTSCDRRMERLVYRSVLRTLRGAGGHMRNIGKYGTCD